MDQDAVVSGLLIEQFFSDAAHIHRSAGSGSQVVRAAYPDYFLSVSDPFLE